MCRKARTRWVGVAGKMEDACVRTAHALHAGYGLLNTVAGRFNLGFGIFARRGEKYSGYGVETISDGIKGGLGWQTQRF